VKGKEGLDFRQSLGVLDMFADRYDLAVSAASAAARDAYVQGWARALTFYPGAIEAFDRAVVADPVSPSRTLVT
jgi:hypothetical protein